MRIVVGIFTILCMGYCYGELDEEKFFYNKFRIIKEEKDIRCGEDKYCVAPDLCLDGKVNTNGEGLIRIRRGFEACVEPYECCSLSNQMPELSMHKMTTVRSCGIRNIGGIENLTKNSQSVADFGEFPWLLRLIGTKSDIYYGGASLIHPQIALTAAHIVADAEADELKVYAGEWFINNTSEPLPHQVRTVAEKVQHERFHRKTLIYDIALLFLSSPFDLQPHISTICLPPPNFDIELITCYATGWGTDSLSSYPKKIDLPIEPNLSCQYSLRQTRLKRYFRLHKSFMCAGGEIDKDVCFGDGGSPLVCPITGAKNQFHQVGIVSWGIDCGLEDVPGVYASLPNLRLWVDEKVTERNFDTISYTN